jgi:hypothetical protein
MERSFILSNKTSVAVQSVIMAKSGEIQSGTDLLGKEFLPEGKAAAIIFDGDETHCLYDFKMLLSDGEVVTLDKVNVCGKSLILHVTDISDVI